jgi:hypothetical protein
LLRLNSIIRYKYFFEISILYNPYFGGGNKNMKKKIIGIIICTVLIATCVLPASGTVMMEKTSILIFDGDILYVGGSGPGNYTSIQVAINDADPGDTVFVYDDSSPYYENIQIGKSINLIGENKETTIIDGKNKSEVVKVSGECDIYGFTITNGTYGFLMDSNSANSTIHDNIISNNCYWGISIMGTLFQSASRVVITRNVFTENGGMNKSTIYGGISLTACSSVKITNNNFINNNWNAFFFKSVFNIWLYNYWDRPRLLPYPIPGLQTIIPPIFWLNFDWRPRLTPYGTT